MAAIIVTTSRQSGIVLFLNIFHLLEGVLEDFLAIQTFSHLFSVGR